MKRKSHIEGFLEHTEKLNISGAMNSRIKINENTMNDFNINTENILKSFIGNDYVYSKTYDRIYKVVGDKDIDYHDVPGDDGIPTILVDTDGGMYDFITLKAENVYEVLSTPNGFSYKEYSKSVGG
jgi:hypothetical protein